jgi:prepilin-type processing-associated H-X9-DG protein
MVLLLPAVKSAVESGRRTKCVANQTKLALAMVMYDGRNNFLPGVRNPLQITNTPLGVPPPGISTPNWFIMLLPLLERQDLFDAVVAGQINFFNANAGNNPFSTGAQLKGLALDLTTCPSRSEWGFRMWSNMHYRANGAGIAGSQSWPVDDGAIGDNSKGIYATMADIAAGDGAATTLMIIEAGAQTWYPQLVTTTSDTDPLKVVYSWPVWLKPMPDSGGGLLFGFSGTLFPTWSHPGGGVVAFADGSTRFLRDSIMPYVYGHLLTRRSVWNGTTYSNNSSVANGVLQAAPAPKPYALDPKDY